MDPLQRINDRAERPQEWHVDSQTTISVVNVPGTDLYGDVGRKGISIGVTK